MLFAILGLLLGVGIGYYIPITIAGGYSLYISVGILAAFDSVLGAIRANIEEKYDAGIFISGFILNSLLAGGLAFIGDLLGIPLYYAAIFAFGIRLFNNFALIRRDILIRMRSKKSSN